MLATIRGTAQCVQILLLKTGGRAIDVADTRGRTALALAAYEGRTDLVRMLLDSGADPNVADSDGRTALFHAVMRNHPEVRAPPACLPARPPARPRLPSERCPLSL
jgi:ankyrin repeat protein